MAMPVIHRVDPGCSEDTVCPSRCYTCTEGHRAGCPLGGHHSDNRGMVRGILCTRCCLLAKQNAQALVKTQHAVVRDMGAWTRGAASRDPQ